MKRLATILALALTAAPVAAASLEAIHRALKPWDITLPPERYRSTIGPINVIFAADPRVSCRQAEGMITLACTLGKAPNPVVTIMPEPYAFRDESFVRSLLTAMAVDVADKTTAASAALWRTSCAPQYSRQVYARLACHEIVGHQLGRWPGSHPER